MPNYFYIAKSLDDHTETGYLNALDESQLAQTLKEKNLILVNAISEEKSRRGEEGGEIGRSFSLPSFLSFFTRVSLKEKIMMTRQMGVMFATGLSLVKSLDVLANQTRNKMLKSALNDIKEKINKGKKLSDALSDYPKIFSELYVNMVEVGEESGNLEEIFQVLSNQLSKEYELKSRIRNALTYPAVILVIMVIVGIVIGVFVLPNLTAFFTSLNAKLPFYTIAFLFIADFLSKKWYLVIIGFIVLISSFLYAIRTKSGKRMLDKFLLKTPVISQIIKKTNSAFMIRSLSSLIVAGVSLVRSLEIVSNSTGNFYFKRVIAQAGEMIKKGEKLSKILKDSQDLFPVGVVEMVEVGEETGRTSDILKKLADFYEQEAASSIEQLTILIEPLLIVIIGLAVAFFAISIIEPLYSSLKSVE